MLHAALVQGHAADAAMASDGTSLCRMLSKQLTARFLLF